MSFSSNKRFKSNNSSNDASVYFQQPFRFKRANEDNQGNDLRSKRRYDVSQSNGQDQYHNNSQNRQNNFQNQQNNFQNQQNNFQNQQDNYQRQQNDFLNSARMKIAFDQLLEEW